MTIPLWHNVEERNVSTVAQNPTTIVMNMNQNRPSAKVIIAYTAQSGNLKIIKKLITLLPQNAKGKNAQTVVQK